jgi:uncharacterized membrane protein YsdA (DUF1294 family)
MKAPRSRPGNRFKRGRLTYGPILILCLLLVIPGYALSPLAAHMDWWILLGVPLIVSLVAFFAYRSDKRRAEAGEWRIPEATLHSLALLGGWPGAFLAQRAFRHKTSKVSFQCVFWAVVLLHQAVAIDSLLDWRVTKGALQAFALPIAFPR